MAAPQAAAPQAAAPQAAAADTVGQIANGLINSRLYVTSEAGNVLDAAQQNLIKQSLAGDGDADIRAMVISNSATASQVRQLLPAVAERVGKGETFVAVTADGSRMAAISKALNRGEINQIITRTNGQPLEQRLIDFGNRAEKKVDDNNASSAVVGYVVLGVFVVLGALVIGAFLTARKRRQAREAKEMDDLKEGVEEDVTRLGEDIARLDLDVMDKGLDPATRADYEHALNSYDQAKRATEHAARPQDMQQVTTALEDGRYYMTATRARLAGEPVPERRPPCFFNPQHGPSVEDVMWAPPGGSARSVPACAADAEAVLHGTDPDIRMVPYQGARRPYWNAGPAYAPYAGGYYYGYGGFDLLGGLLIGTTLGSLMGGGLGWGGGYGGMDGFGDGGGDIGGGWDFGGGDWGGGGDFGGF
ncbi:hypothetical protein E1284_31170 [Actinomadura bangladeshensis]|uniref:Uncharacterized protein n=2 Tax=Actinomadura bangladeshensis TaxID=453573 RepID=A0A4R4NGD0_9ACTN|nr:hypothetical protein E1284_31170 [Actinomadura bangladeshensis]